MSQFEILFDYQREPARRAAFHDFVEQNFLGVSFRKWDALGGWTSSYHPASVFHRGHIVANASVSMLDVIVGGETRRAAQFATVGTLPPYRRQGFSARLMHRWLQRLRAEQRLCFLFGNEDVLDFYPRFGFRRVPESRFVASAIPPAKRSLTRVDFDSQEQRSWLLRLAKEREPITHVFGCHDYSFILLFHLLLEFSGSVYRCEESDAAVVAQHQDDTLHIYDVLARRLGSVARLVEGLCSPQTRAVVFHFTPDRVDLPTRPVPVGDESPFFVWLPAGERALPEALRVPFKFPALAQT